MLDPEPDRRAGPLPVLRLVQAGPAGPAAARDRMERPGPGPPRRRAGRDTDRRLAVGDLASVRKARRRGPGRLELLRRRIRHGLKAACKPDLEPSGQTPLVTVTGGRNTRVSLHSADRRQVRAAAPADLPRPPGHRARRQAQRLHRGRLRPAAGCRAPAARGIVDDVDTPSMNARDSYGERRPRSFMASGKEGKECAGVHSRGGWRISSSSAPSSASARC